MMVLLLTTCSFDMRVFPAHTYILGVAAGFYVALFTSFDYPALKGYK